MIAVIGAGTMGNGIAHVFAQKGYKTNLVDVSQDQLDKALATITKNLDRQVTKGSIDENAKTEALKNISLFTSVEEGVKDAELVVEAATENIDLKLKIFQSDGSGGARRLHPGNQYFFDLHHENRGCYQTSGKVIGMHFMNPVPVMKLVEIINGYATEERVTEHIVELSKKLGKIPCVVNDYPGFIANRILMPMINEAIYSLYEGVAGVEEIDTVMKLGMAHPMGPLQLADFIGLDVCHSILNVLHEGFGNPKYAPCPLLTNMVTAGYLGAKSGEGFYKYTAGSKELVVSERFNN